MSSAHAHPDARFAAWMREHGGILGKVSRSYAATARERMELEKELMFQVWTSAARFNADAKPATWIYRVCLNTAFNWRRAAKRQEDRNHGTPDSADLAAAGADPAAATERNDLFEQLYAGLRTLNELDRSLLLLQLDGLGYREIADITGLTENHVGVALTRARQRLAAQLKGVLSELE